MENEFMRTIEVNGVKMEVDLRYAKRIDTFRIGDSVKVLDKRSGKNEMRPGVVTDFADFKDLPTMTIAIHKQDWWGMPDIEFITYNADTEDIEVVGVSAEELVVSKYTIVDKFEDAIRKKRAELNDLIVKRDTFIKYFGKENKDA